jgi:tRNA nucleotidyltransferase (CCA-adding enzyme)
MDTKVHLIARSSGVMVNVGKIAEEFGGGGHAYAASASFKEMTLIQAEECRLIRCINISRRAHRKRMMSAPVLSVEQDKNYSRHQDLLDGYTVNTLLVVDESQNPLGYITRQIVQRAIFHGLETECVQEYMLTDVKTVSEHSIFRH